MGHLFDVTLDEKKSEYTQRNLHGIIISDDNNKKNYIPVYSILKNVINVIILLHLPQTYVPFANQMIYKAKII